MRGGHVRAWLSKLLMYGAAGSGKSTTKEMIVGNPPPPQRESTPLAVRPTTVYRVSVEGKEFAQLTTLEEKKMFIARAMVNIDPDLPVDMLRAQYIAEAATSVGESTPSGPGEPQVKSKEQSSNAESVPPSTSAVQPAVLDSSESLSSEDSSDIDSRVDNILQSISTDDELVQMMDELSRTVHPQVAFRILQIIDSGGQPQFHEILPIFLRRLYLYVFVFRLCDDLFSRPEVEYYVDGKPVGKAFTSNQTIEQLLQHCARSMYSQRSASGDDGECPKIMIIATHLDREKESSETREQKNTTILKLLLPTLAKQIVYRNVDTKDVLYTLNGKTPGDHEKVTIEQIRDVLLSRDSIQPVDIPLKWFALEILLEELSRTLKQRILHREDCFSAAVEKLHFEDEAEFDAAIQYLDELSVLFYYPHILPDVIFADPQVILDEVTELVIASFQRCNVAGKGDDWRKFYEFALVTQEFLSQKEFSKHYVPGLFEVNDLVSLFTKLLIFAHFSSTQLFVPALLHDFDKEEVKKHRVSSTTLPSLAIQFPDGGPRRGIFCGLLCWLVSPENESSFKWSISVDEVGSPISLYRNCVQFDLCGSPATITLIDTYTHFEVHIDVEEAWVDDLYPKLIPKVRESIFKGLHKAAINLHYYSSSPWAALVCPCGEECAHIATGNVELGFWTCAQSRPKRKCGKLSPHQILWLNPTSSDNGIKELSESDLPHLLGRLDEHASKWRDIGMHLGFRQTELDNIQAIPLLLTGAPKSFLRAMLSEWLQWAPNDGRGSSSFASLQALKDALNKSGLGATASSL